MNDRIVVIGAGNPLMGDDGLGLAALELLEMDYRIPPNVELLDGGTWGIQLLPAIEAADEVILIDAIEARASPGQLVILEDESLPRMFDLRISPHQIGIQDTLALLELRGTRPARMSAIGLQPGRVEWGIGLSPEVERALPTLVAAVARRLGDRAESRRSAHA
jgi:hydrogenase maturation protease